MVKKLSSRRALSQIITSLILIAIVSTIGSTVLFRGLGEINSFLINIDVMGKNRIEGVQEDLVFENVRFKNSPDRIEISVTNFGSVDSTISSILVTESITQKIIYQNRTFSESLKILENGNFTLKEDTTEFTGDDSHDYIISILTTRGNMFTEFANRPYT